MTNSLKTPVQTTQKTQSFKIDLSFTKKFIYTEVIQVPAGFTEKDLNTLLDLRKVYAPAEEYRMLMGHKHTKDCAINVALGSSAGVPEVEAYLDNGIVKTRNISKHQVVKTQSASVGVCGDTFDEITREFNVFTNPAIEDELIIDLSGIEEEEVTARLALKLVDYDVRQLVGLNYLTVYVE